MAISKSENTASKSFSSFSVYLVFKNENGQWIEQSLPKKYSNPLIGQPPGNENFWTPPRIKNVQNPDPLLSLWGVHTMITSGSLATYALETQCMYVLFSYSIGPITLFGPLG